MKEFIQGIKNIIYWFPIIWKDKNYDYAFMDYILLHKMKKMYKYFLSKDSFCSKNPKLKQHKSLRLCIMLLERQDEEFYLSLYKNQFDNDIEKIINIQQRDVRLFSDIFKKYREQWWD